MEERNHLLLKNTKKILDNIDSKNQTLILSIEQIGRALREDFDAELEATDES